VSTAMRIESVRLIAAERSYEWKFEPGVNIVVGPVGVGKTSLLELIHWGLGGTARLSGAVEAVGRQLALTVRIGEQRLMLLRGIRHKKNQVAVHDVEGSPITVLRVGQPAEANSVSKFLLDQLKVPAVRVPRSRRNPAGKHTTVSFNDLYSYMYLPQTEIDRSTINHLEGVRDPKRRSTFEVIYGLIDAEMAKLQVEIGNLSEEISRAKSSIAEIEQFVEALELPAIEVLEERLQSSERVLSLRERELADVRDGMRGVGLAGSSRRRVEDLAAELNAALSDREAAATQCEELERLTSQIALDEQRTVRSMMAGTELAGIEYRACPRCLQDVSQREAPEGTCVLCHQQEPESLLTVTLEDELERLRRQQRESEVLLADARGEDALLKKRVQELETSLTAARTAADREAEDAVAPFVDQVGALSTEIGELRARLDGDQEGLRLHVELERRRTMLQKLVDRQAKLGSLLDQEKERQQLALARVDELSIAFDEILQSLQLPWYEPSYIDPKNYLPMVGGKKLEDLSSGGMKVLVNDSYFLAGLAYALRVPEETHLPSLMVIDSPMKNFGAGEDDLSYSHRLYRWLWALQKERGANRFQLIIADNEIPAEAEEFNIRRLSYEEPLIDDLPHPGPKVKTLS
jgi:AAA domain